MSATWDSTSLENIAVIFVRGKTLRADNDATSLGHDNGGLGFEFRLLVLLALADAADFQFMKAVNFVCVPALLVDGLVVAGKFILPDGETALRQLAHDIPQLGQLQRFSRTATYEML